MMYAQPPRNANIIPSLPSSFRFLHPNLEAEGAVVRAFETEDNMADCLTLRDDQTSTPTPTPQNKQMPPSEPSTPRPESQTPQTPVKNISKDPDQTATPERPPRRKNNNSVKSHSRQTSTTSSSTKCHSRQTSTASSVSGYSSLASSLQYASSSAAAINCDLDGGSCGGTGSIESLSQTPSPPSKEWRMGGSGDTRLIIDSNIIASDRDEDWRIKTASSATLAAGLRTPRVATTPTSLRSKAFFPNFNADGAAQSGAPAPKSRNDFLAHTRVSSDEVVDQLLFAELT